MVGECLQHSYLPFVLGTEDTAGNKQTIVSPGAPVESAAWEGLAINPNGGDIASRCGFKREERSWAWWYKLISPANWG